MNNKTIFFSAFILVALVQLCVPAKMIWDREDVIKTGVEYKFRTAPVDPNDIFRGKYIALDFGNNTIEVAIQSDFEWGDEVYAKLTKDGNGFAKIKSVSIEKPANDVDYVKGTIRSLYENGTKELTIDYPFDRFYMEESKALPAEELYRKTQRDSSKITYALVSVKNGQSVLRDVLIDGVSIGELVKREQGE